MVSMKEDFKFKLTRPARSSGGDRYEFGKKGDELWMVFYIPQLISRSESDSLPRTPVKELFISINTESLP